MIARDGNEIETFCEKRFCMSYATLDAMKRGMDAVHKASLVKSHSFQFTSIL